MLFCLCMLIYALILISLLYISLSLSLVVLWSEHCQVKSQLGCDTMLFLFNHVLSQTHNEALQFTRKPCWSSY